MNQFIPVLLSACLTVGSGFLYAQNGPGGVGNTSGSSDLKLWLRSDVGVTTVGTAVTSWQDQSGNGNDVSNSAATNRPALQNNGANGQDYLRFDGTNDFLEMGSTSADFSNTASTIFIVGEGSLNRTMISVASSGINQEMLMRGNQIFHHASSGNFNALTHQCESSIPDAEARILTGVFGVGENDLDFEVNSSLSTQTITTTNSASNPVADFSTINRQVRIGRRSNGEYLTGDLYEVIYYDRELTVAEREDVEDYLRCKYNIANNGCGTLVTSDTCGCVDNGPGGVGNTSGSSDLKLWLRPDIGVATAGGTAVTAWLDQSGYGHNVSNSAATNRPSFQTSGGANGQFFIQFDGTDDFLEMTGTDVDFSNPRSTIFIVGEGSLNRTMISVASNGINQEMLMRGNQIFHHASSGNFNALTHQCESNVPDTAARILTGVFGVTRNDLDFEVNGRLSTNTITSTNGASNPVADFSTVNRRVRIGRRSNGEYLTGVLYEVIYYDRELTVAEREDVEEYLRCKYDLTNNGCGDLSNDPCGFDCTQQIPVALPRINQVNTSVAEVEATYTVQVFPNPTSGLLTVAAEGQQLERVEIVSLTGQVLQSFQVQTSNYQLNVQDLPTGIYFVRVTNLAQEIAIQKFVKQ